MGAKLVMESITAVLVGPTCQELGGLSLVELSTFALAEIEWPRIRAVICGINPGWDQAVGLTALDIGVPLHIVIPYFNWEKKFTGAVLKHATKMLDEAMTIVSMAGEHDEQPANRYMGECGDEVLGLIPPGWMNSRLSVLTLKKMPLRNLWGAFQEVFAKQ